jgi:hypothetical protein
MGGWPELTNGTPIWRDDHPLYLHSALVTRHFLAQSGTTAGYDPAFMAGYPKSIVFPASSTLPELCIAVTGGRHPVEVYKAYCLTSAALIPWLIWLSTRAWKGGRGAACASVVFFLAYIWSDFPMQYAAFGMLPYLLAIPLGLLTVGVFCRFLESGDFRWWLVSAGLFVSVTLVHFTSAMIVGPAAAAAYVSIFGEGTDGPTRRSRWRHAGVWSIPALTVLLNAFWWAPALWLWKTKGPSDFAFHHPEGVMQRLWQIAVTEAPIERVLVVIGLVGLLALARSRERNLLKLGLATFILAGFFWGYASAHSRSLDFLQPGRHTYAFYSGLAVAAGLGLERFFGWLRVHSRFRVDLIAALLLIGAGSWYLGPSIWSGIEGRVFSPIPFLTSRPSPWLLWVERNVRKFVRPGERLLYEEGGKDVPGAPDPFQGGRFSGFLADKYQIELIGGPYLHASLTTNFTQFGEGKLFGNARWDRDWFVRYARLYRPAAILCWTPEARAFCQANPDLIELKADGGDVVFGRVIGFEGETISGKAEIVASPGKLRVSKAEGGLDGTVVLRYHSVPCLRSNPSVDWEPVFLEDDPVPFIRLRPPPGGGPVTFRLGMIHGE